MGMAFADTLVAESDADVIIVDRHARPGAHWNDAYPFVRLHQASTFYGVSSRPARHDHAHHVRLEQRAQWQKAFERMQAAHQLLSQSYSSWRLRSRLERATAYGYCA